MTKKFKRIGAICDNCSKQLYPAEALNLNNLDGITISLGKCDICGKSSGLVPIRDFWYALTNNFKYWD